jgi:hypothetical protein
MMSVNHARGEVPLLIEGEPHRLCLTLGALAEIEQGLGAADLKHLEARLAKPSMADIIVILGALLRGGGHDVTDVALSRRKLDLKEIGRAIAAAFAADGDSAQGEAPAPRSPETGSGGAGSFLRRV